jgi:[ribosomal protein S5]-alanine N-acetyltransferase
VLSIQDDCRRMLARDKFKNMWKANEDFVTRLQFRRLSEVRKSDIIELMNNDKVNRQMPLLNHEFKDAECEKFIASKEEHWNKFGFGLWAFVIDEHFFGWGGLQMENDEPDLALVLHPDYWGTGKYILKLIINRAFTELRLSSITILLPASRTRIKGVLRLGFREEGELIINNHRFSRFRLNNSHSSDLNKIK